MIEIVCDQSRIRRRRHRRHVQQDSKSSTGMFFVHVGITPKHINSTIHQVRSGQES